MRGGYGASYFWQNRRLHRYRIVSNYCGSVLCGKCYPCGDGDESTVGIIECDNPCCRSRVVVAVSSCGDCLAFRQTHTRETSALYLAGVWARGNSEHHVFVKRTG